MLDSKRIAISLIAMMLCAEVRAQVVYRINCGGPDYVDPDGNLWRSDAAVGYYNTGESFAVDETVGIEGTDLDPLYRSHRYDSSPANPDMVYAFPVDPGFYSVRLHFAEVYWNSEGRRRFDVMVEDELVLVAYDIYGLAGGKNVADVQQFVANIAAGDPTIAVAFMHGAVDHPLICAIEIEAIPPAPIITNGDTESLNITKNSDCMTTANLLALNAVDPDTDPALLSWGILDAPTLGTVSLVGGIQTGASVIVCYEPAPGQIAPDSFTIEVSDGDAGSDNDAIEVMVTVLDTEAPTITCPADVTVDAGAPFTPDDTGRATAIDDFGGAPTITFNDVVAPGDCPIAVVVRRTWTARDPAGNARNCLQRIFIRDADTDGDGAVDCEDSSPDDPAVGGNNGGNSDGSGGTGGDSGGGSDNGNANDGGSGDSGGGGQGGGSGGGFIDPTTGQPIPGDECCGGGVPAMTPLMLFGWRRVRRRRAKRDSIHGS